MIIKASFSLAVLCAAVAVGASVVAVSSSIPPFARASAFRALGRLDARARLTFTVALRQRNLQWLERAVQAVSTPQSPRYGHYLSLRDLSRRLAPRTSALREVTAFFVAHGGSVSVPASRDYLVVELGVAAVEKVFGGQVTRYRHRRSGRALVRLNAARAKLPSPVERHIQLVLGLDDFVEYRAEKRLRARLRSHAARRAASSNAPAFVRLNGGSSDVKAEMWIFCKNGQPTKDAAAPCSDNPPLIASLTLTVAPRQFPPIVVTSSISDLHCGTNPEPPFGSELVCVSPLVMLPEFAPVNLSAYVTYTDGSASDVGNFQTEYAPSPYVFPNVINHQYGLPLGMRGTNASNSISVTAFEEQYISIHHDLRAFLKNSGLPYVEPAVHGVNNASQPGGESTLDIQYIMGTAPGVPAIFWSVSGPGPTHGGGAFILDWAFEIGNTTTPPWITSISYGDTEQGFYEYFGSYDYIVRMNVELAKMAARGLTVIAGSGDAGVSNVGEQGNDISDTDPTCTPFRPFFPSNSPYVLSVGSTYLSPHALPACFAQSSTTQQAVLCRQLGEVAVSVRNGLFWTTGGGFSNFTAAPSWQRDAIQTYLASQRNESALPPAEYWNATGRGYPDLATIGHNLMCVWGGVYRPVDGTSASGPVLAGLVALLNDARLNKGLPTLGFMNPWLYGLLKTNPEAFNDVVVGANFDGDIQPPGSPYPTRCSFGFNTAPMWDPVTGLGSPNWAVLRQLAVSGH